MTNAEVDVVPVVLVRIPVAVWARTQEHTDELLREFTLVAAQLRERPGAQDVPVRLVELVEQMTQRYGGLNIDQENRLADAAAAGVPELDLTYWVPPDAIEVVKALGDILDEADAYCLEGAHLLTLATPPDLIRFRHWFLDEFTNQLRGAGPSLYADYRG